MSILSCKSKTYKYRIYGNDSNGTPGIYLCDTFASSRDSLIIPSGGNSPIIILKRPYKITKNLK